MVSHDRRRVSDEDDPWRKRVLELEEENESLKLSAQKQELGKRKCKLEDDMLL